MTFRRRWRHSFAQQAVCLGRLMKVVVNGEGRSFAVKTMHDPDEQAWWFAIPEAMRIER